MTSFWQAWQQFGSGLATLADWQLAFGEDFPLVAPWLRPTQQLGRSFRCSRRPRCHCRHSVRVVEGGTLAGICHCGQCEPIEVVPAQLMICSLDRLSWGAVVRRAFGWQAPQAGAGPSRGGEPIACYGPRRTPVYWEHAFACVTPAGPLEPFLGGAVEPCILLVPVLPFPAAGANPAPASSQVCVLAAAELLRPLPGGRLELVQNPEPQLQPWAAQLAQPSNTAQILRSLYCEIAAVRTGFHELDNARGRLEKLLGEGLFAFTRKIDPTSFKVFCMILAEGNTAQAARSLRVPDSTLRDQLASWRGRGPAYRTLLELLRWRRSMGRRVSIPFDDTRFSERNRPPDYAGILSDVLDGLLAMNEENWKEQCEQLTELLRSQR